MEWFTSFQAICILKPVGLLNFINNGTSCLSSLYIELYIIMQIMESMMDVKRNKMLFLFRMSLIQVVLQVVLSQRAPLSYMLRQVQMGCKTESFSNTFLLLCLLLCLYSSLIKLLAYSANAFCYVIQRMCNLKPFECGIYTL